MLVRPVATLRLGIVTLCCCLTHCLALTKYDTKQERTSRCARQLCPASLGLNVVALHVRHTCMFISRTDLLLPALSEPLWHARQTHR